MFIAKGMQNNKNKVWHLFIIFGSIAFLPSLSYADCSNPAGVESEIVYNTSFLTTQYCDGTNWIAMHQPGSGSGGCSSPAGVETEIVYNTSFSVMQACAGNQWMAMGPVPGGGAPDLSAGLVAHWNLDDGSGTTANDSAGTHDGTFQGTPGWVTGINGGAVNFDDNADYIEITDNAALEGYSALTLSAWINPQGEPGASYGRIVHKSNTSTGDIYVLKYVPTSHEIIFGVNTTVDGLVDFESDVNISPGSGWHHVVGVWDGKNMNLYINGRIDRKVSGGASPKGHATGSLITNNENVGIGRHVLSSARNFNGYIDDVRIYNRALTYKEIHDLYTSTGGDFAISGCAATKCGGQSGERVVFVGGHSIGSDGMRIGGVSGADSWCQQEAIYNAGLSGVYKAWIADSDANSAPATRFEQASVPYVMTDGTQVADNWTDLTDGTLDTNIDLDETGVTVTATQNVATNVDTDGTQYSATLADSCTDWTYTSDDTARHGSNQLADGQWTSYGNPQCNHPKLLYCFEQPGTFLTSASPCPAREEGTIFYNSANKLMQYCDGAGWVSIGASSDPCAVPSPVLGTECLDGSVYAGQTTDGNVKMFATRCDYGMTWNGASCTGSRTEPPWNDGNTSGYVTTGVTDDNAGAANTAALITIDSDGITGGTQPHQAAQACADLTAGGRDDWYLPAHNELYVLYTNQVAIGGFSVGPYYWTSEEYDNDGAYTLRMDGSFGTTLKSSTGARPIRCVRKN